MKLVKSRKSDCIKFFFNIYSVVEALNSKRHMYSLPLALAAIYLCFGCPCSRACLQMGPRSVKENYRPSTSTLHLLPTRHQYGADNELARDKLKGENCGNSTLSTLMLDIVLCNTFMITHYVVYTEKNARMHHNLENMKRIWSRIF